MARRQTRRGVSLNAAAYNAILMAARARGISTAEFVTDLARKAGVEIPETAHMTRAAAFLAVANKRQKARDKANGWVR